MEEVYRARLRKLSGSPAGDLINSSALPNKLFSIRGTNLLFSMYSFEDTIWRHWLTTRRLTYSNEGEGRPSCYTRTKRRWLLYPTLSRYEVFYFVTVLVVLLCHGMICFYFVTVWVVFNLSRYELLFYFVTVWVVFTLSRYELFYFVTAWVVFNLSRMSCCFTLSQYELFYIVTVWVVLLCHGKSCFTLSRHELFCVFIETVKWWAQCGKHF